MKVPTYTVVLIVVTDQFMKGMMEHTVLVVPSERLDLNAKHDIYTQIFRASNPIGC